MTILQTLSLSKLTFYRLCSLLIGNFYSHSIVRLSLKTTLAARSNGPCVRIRPRSVATNTSSRFGLDFMHSGASFFSRSLYSDILTRLNRHHPILRTIAGRKIACLDSKNFRKGLLLPEVTPCCSLFVDRHLWVFDLIFSISEVFPRWEGLSSPDTVSHSS